MTRGLKTVLAIALLAAVPAWSSEPDTDYQSLLGTLHITSMRAGADGMNPKAPNYANFDEARAGIYVLPDPLRRNDGTAVATASDWWGNRRPELVELFDREVYGRMPQKVPGVVWQLTGAEVRAIGSVQAITQHLVGHVDNSAYPGIRVDIAMDLTLPLKTERPAPVMIVLTWKGPWANMPVPPDQGIDWREQLLSAGWGYAEYVPTSVQADNGKGLRAGIIGLANKGAARGPDQWGALRAWAWGASRAVDYLSTDRRVDAKRIGVTGHSRYGKAALVAMAYDARFAIGYISSSGAGGAKLLRRNYGETLENLSGEGEYHWMAGNFVAYGGPKTVNELPVDAHELIALCAPRPVFIGSGTREAGDGWTDPKGMFLAAVAAGPVYRLLGAGDLGTAAFPAVGTPVSEGALAFRQHPFGHTPQPNWAAFLEFAKRRLN